MVTRLLHIPILLLLLLLTPSALSWVIPPLDSSTGLSHSLSSPSSSSKSKSNDLAKLHPLKTPGSLVCRANNQRMSCYGGNPVTLGICKNICTCENGRISCPNYKFCDDSTMDTFCGGMCGCSTNTNSPSSHLRTDNDDRDHRYLPSSPRHMYDEDDEEDDEDDDEDNNKAAWVYDPQNAW